MTTISPARPALAPRPVAARPLVARPVAARPVATRPVVTRTVVRTVAVPAAAEPRETGRVVGQVVVDGAYLLPRSLVATRRLLRGDGVPAYRATFPGTCARSTTSPQRLATHAALGLFLGLLTLAVVGGFAAAVLLLSPLLLAPAGVAGLLLFGAAGAAHERLTRRLVDRGRR